MTDAKKHQGSNADVAEGGLNVEASFADTDNATAIRLAREAVQETTNPTGGAPADTNASFREDQNHSK